MQGVCTPPPSWREALFYVSEFKTCLPQKSVAPFLSGAPLRRKIPDPPLLPSLIASLVVFFPLSSLVVSYLPGKRQCLLSVIILNTQKQSFVIDCYDESKPCHDHFASFVTSSHILFNPVETGPLSFFKYLTVGVEGDFGGQHPVSVTLMTDHET